MVNKLPVIGSTEYVEIFGVSDIPAKIDTGADSSSIWATNMKMEKDGTLIFSLFGEKSPLYTGKRIETKDYEVRLVRSSHGDTQVRYRVKLPLKIGGIELISTFTLANRVRNSFPVLIGRKTLEGKFLVDVSRSGVVRKRKTKSRVLNEELKENPYKFHQKYIEKGE